ECRELARRRNGDDVYGPTQGEYVPRAQPARRALAGSHAEQRANGDVASVGARVDARRIPRGRDEPFQRRRSDVATHVIDGDRIDPAEDDVESSLIGRERERCGGESGLALAKRRNGNVASHFVRL